MSKGIKDSNQELLAENERLKRLIGELTTANDSFKKFWRANQDEEEGGEASSGQCDA